MTGDRRRRIRISPLGGLFGPSGRFFGGGVLCVLRLAVGCCGRGLSQGRIESAGVGSAVETVIACWALDAPDRLKGLSVASVAYGREGFIRSAYCASGRF